MNNVRSLFIAAIILACSSCDDAIVTPAPTFTQVAYTVIDSVYQYISTDASGTQVTYTHHNLDRDIAVFHNLSKDKYVVATDTFSMCDSANNTFCGQNTFYATMSLHNDTMVRYKHIGGVAYQTNLFVYSVKK